jgi:hypothetical protein
MQSKLSLVKENENESIIRMFRWNVKCNRG